MIKIKIFEKEQIEDKIVNEISLILFLCPTEGHGPSSPLQLASVKFEGWMNVCL
jgi:hypothetical protein